MLMVRVKTRPSPLSQVRTSGVLSVRVAPGGAVQTVSGVGSLADTPLAGMKPCSAKVAPTVPAGDSSVMVGLLGSMVSR